MKKSKSAIKKHLWGSLPYMFYSLFKPKSEKIQYYKYFKDNGYSHFPYQYAEKYVDMNVSILIDKDRDLPYINHGAKRLYFPRILSNDKIIRTYKALMIEQDIQSPHRYVDSLQEFENKVLLDIGSAEGFTSLDAIEAVKFVYLFECDPKWIEALSATFEPWKDKVEIIKKYISHNNEGLCQTLDDFLKDKPKDNLFLKMDIEGEERNALEGAKKLFSGTDTFYFAICVYHKKDDYRVISSFLNRYDCNHKLREGLFYNKHSLCPCLIRGRKG